MGGNTDVAPGGVLRVPIQEFSAVPLPPAVRMRWSAWRDMLQGHSKAERSQALREAAMARRPLEGLTQEVLFPSSPALKAARQARLQRLQERLAAAERKREGRLAGRAGFRRSGDGCDDELLMERLAAPHEARNKKPSLRMTLHDHEQVLRRQHSVSRIQRGWRAFASEHMPTVKLARRYAACGLVLAAQQEAAAAEAAEAAEEARAQEARAAGGFVMIGGMGSGDGARHARFEEFALKLQAAPTLRAAQALLTRLEQRLAVAGGGGAADGALPLLKRLFPAAPAGKRLQRYPVRVFLCAYMICSHPQMVFNSVGDTEARLSAAAAAMLAAFDGLVEKLLAPLPPAAAAAPAASAAVPAAVPAANACPSPLTKSAAAYRARQPSLLRRAGSGAGSILGSSGSGSAAAALKLGQLLVRWDELWLEYLDQFVVWKSADASALVSDLVGMAARLEASMRRKVGREGPAGERVAASDDLQALVAQVAHDQALLRERIERLTGAEGVAQLEAALEAACAEVEENEDWETSSERSSRLPSRANSTLSDSLPDADQAQQQQQAQRESGPKNEQMVWEMLYNPGFTLPVADAEAAWARSIAPEGAAEDEAPLDPEELQRLPAEQLAAIVTQRAKIVAERAFWDSIKWRFHTAMQGQGLSGQLAPLLSELGMELAQLVSDPLATEQLADQYSEPKVVARLGSRTGDQVCGINVSALGAMLEQLSAALLPLAPAEHAAAAAAAGQAVQARLAAALATEPGEHNVQVAAALAPVLTSALRCLMTQSKLAKLAAANARLVALARLMQERGAVGYLRSKLAAAWKLPGARSALSVSEAELGAAEGEQAPAPQVPLTREALVDRLPKSAAWLSGAAADALPPLQQGLAAAGLSPGGVDGAAGAASEGIAGSMVPSLRTGMSRSASGKAPAAAPGAAAAAVAPVLPVEPSSWRGLFRAALLSLVAADAPAAGEALPELLVLDGERLHAAQNGFQRLMVTAASLLIVQQLRGASGMPWGAEQQAAAARRLRVLLSDPGMRLSDVVSELTALAGSASEAPVKAMFMRIVNPDSAAFKSIRSGLCTALYAHLLLGGARLAPDAAAGQAVAAALARVGASVLQQDVAAAAEQLLRVAAVNEAVHEELLPLLA